MKANYRFQAGLVSRCLSTLKTKSGVVLASAPGAGKTEMSIEVIQRWLATNNEKVLVLTHGQTVLRSQYHNRLIRKERPFSFGMLTSQSGNVQADVHVALPHYFANKSSKGYGLIVVDEAHHFFEAPMVKNVLADNPGAKLLLLTGTPSPFVASKRFPLVSFTASQLLENGIIRDPNIELVKTSLPFGLKSFNRQDNLKTEIGFSRKQTDKALDSALNQLLATLTARLKGTRNTRKFIKKLTGKKLVAALMKREMGKTMVICHRQDQAREVLRYFKGKSISATLSTCDDDLTSLNVEQFRTDDTKVLVVVNRATLGFDLPSLCNILDLSMTHNPDRIFQALCRVVRRGPNNESKTYIKVTTEGLAELTYLVMSFVVALSLPEYYESFDGKWKDTKIKVPGGWPPGPGGGCGGVKRKKSWWEDLLPLPSLIDVGNAQLEKNSHLYAYTTFSEARARLAGVRESGFWTKEQCSKEARKYITQKAFLIGSPSAYSASQKKGWLQEFKSYWKPSRVALGHWLGSFANCAAEAKKYSTRKAFRNGSPGAAQAATDNGWLTEITAHMQTTIAPRGYWTKEQIMKAAKECSSRSEFRTKYVRAACVADDLGIFDEVCKHMTRKQAPFGFWSRKAVIAEARKYETRSSFSDGNGAAYSKAKELGIFEEACRHMPIRAKPRKK